MSCPYNVDMNVAPQELQMKPVYFQCSTEQPFHSLDFVEFMHPRKTSRLIGQVLKVISLFERAYQCERLFSTTKRTKYKMRSRRTKIFQVAGEWQVLALNPTATQRSSNVYTGYPDIQYIQYKENSLHRVSLY